MTPADLAALISCLTDAGVREATFHPDGTPARLVFDAPPHLAPIPSADAPAKPQPQAGVLAHSRMRPRTV